MKVLLYRTGIKNDITKSKKPFYWDGFQLICLLSLCFIANICTATPHKASTAPTLSNQSFANRPDVQNYLRTLQKKHGFTPAELQNWFGSIRANPGVIVKITTPHEAKPWYEYRTLFVKPNRIEEGVTYWNTHRRALKQAESKYGVPTQLIVAIIGVETHYGKHLGTYPILQSLATLAFDYSPRAAFFKKELTEYLLLCREEGFDPLSLKGSYAGAIGIPQFMPSSYRNYAIGLHGESVADIIHHPKDAIASVGHYLALNGWQARRPIASPMQFKKIPEQRFISRKLAPQFSLQTLSNYGIKPKITGLSSTALANVINLETNKKQSEYWLGFHNFYVITKYNTSTLYAMAVYQLSQAIAEAHRKELHPLKKG